MNIDLKLGKLAVELFHTEEREAEKNFDQFLEEAPRDFLGAGVQARKKSFLWAFRRGFMSGAEAMVQLAEKDAKEGS